MGQTVITSYEYEKTEPNKIDVLIQNAWDERSGTKYFIVNENPYGQLYHNLENTYFEITTNKESPGYAGYHKIVNQNKAVQDVQIPVMAGRDLSNIEILNFNGKEYLFLNDLIFISEKDMAELYAGENAVCTIQEGGYAKWYTINKNDVGKTMTGISALGSQGRGGD